MRVRIKYAPVPGQKICLSGNLYSLTSTGVMVKDYTVKGSEEVVPIGLVKWSLIEEMSFFIHDVEIPIKTSITDDECEELKNQCMEFFKKEFK